MSNNNYGVTEFKDMHQIYFIVCQNVNKKVA